jgi:predicted ATPase
MHTPGSFDFVDRGASGSDWVKAALAAGLQVVAITDHNSPEWVSTIQEAARDTPLVVFPAVEITVNGGIHLLAILPVGSRPAAIAALLGACKIPSARLGTQEACSPLSFQEVAEIIDRHKGICLAAHADGEDGFLTKLVKIAPDGKGSGEVTLQQIVQSPHLLGVEANQDDQRLLAYLDNTRAAYWRPNGPLALLEASDAHALSKLGQRWTWIKMSSPDLEGLRLALLDGELSVRRGSRVAGDPNARAADLVESIEIAEARYIGRGAPLAVPLNPWLNAIIGGHGTGKSSIVEFFRIAMRRDDEVPDSLRGEFKKYTEAYRTREDRGLLTPATTIRVVFRKDGDRFRIQWSFAGSASAIEMEAPDGAWRPAPGEVRSRFPVRVFSQKQIYTLADEPGALLSVIDESPAVDAVSLRAEIDREEKGFLSLRAQLRAIEAETREEARLRGSLDDVRRKIALFESSDHREILTGYQVVERQQRAVEAWARSLEEAVRRADALDRDLVPDDLPARTFPEPGAARPAEQAALQAVASALAELARIRADARALAARAGTVLEQFRTALTAPPWSAHVSAARRRYEDLRRQLASAGAGDPTEYGRLVQERHTLETRLNALESKRAAMADLERQASERLARLAGLRAELTARRQQFLEEALRDNEHVRIAIVPHGDRLDAERALRRCIDMPEHTFQDQIWSEDGRRGLLRDLYEEAPPAASRDRFLQALEALKARLIGAARGAAGDLHGKFVTHLRRLQAEALDRLEALYPEDAVTVAYRSRPGTEFRPIEQGSPGQKSAAVLAFLLAHGVEPLVLDQPEDDLDNQLISDLIVAQLRQMKSRRQMLIVTHNPNIVVNGDAELVLPLVSRNGQTQIDDAGGIQERAVRDAICRVMEGGREALERRYRRIRGGADHV